MVPEFKGFYSLINQEKDGLSNRPSFFCERISKDAVNVRKNKMTRKVVKKVLTSILVICYK